MKILVITILSLFINEDLPVFSNNGETLSQFFKSHTIYPSYAKQNCIQGTIKVSFQLNAKGDLFNAKIKSGFGVDLDDEALRLIMLTNHKWKVPKSHKEATEIIIPVVFSLENYNCERLSKQSIENAIGLYQTRQASEDIVTNYYRNKTGDVADAKREKQISQLKADLGFDEELVEQKLEEAQAMLSQGDKEGACKTLTFIKNIGFPNADVLIVENCK